MLVWYDSFCLGELREHVDWRGIFVLSKCSSGGEGGAAKLRKQLVQRPRDVQELE